LIDEQKSINVDGFGWKLADKRFRKCSTLRYDQGRAVKPNPNLHDRRRCDCVAVRAETW